MSRQEQPVRRRTWAVAVVAAVFALLASACSGIPTSGSPQDIRQVADQSTGQRPPGPDAGQQPEQIVREFIHASALTSRDSAGESFVVARQFLTDSAARTWQADPESSRAVVLADDFSAIPDPDHPGRVSVSGTQIGSLDPDRSYHPADATTYKATMQLSQQDGQWRISQLPGSLLITQNDFGTAFRQRAVYFLDASGRVVVPDLRYIPNPATPDLSANRLMDLLLRGPARELAGAARTALGPTAELESNVHVDAKGIAHVDLASVDVSTPAARQSLAAQIVWTLYPDVQQIAITVNGLPLDAAAAPNDQRGSSEPGASAQSPVPRPQTDTGTVYSLTNGTVSSFDPDAVPGSAQAVSDAYYISDGAIVRLSDSTPMWGSVGTGSVHVVSAALSAASGALAAVARDGDGGEQLLVGMPFDHQPTVTALKASSLTSPSFTRWGYTVWTVQNGDTQPEVYQVSASSGTPTWSRVLAPQLADLGKVTALALSPDGVRVAVVADGALYLGVVAPTGGDDGETHTRAAPGRPLTAADNGDGSSEPRGVQITGLHELRPDLTDVGPVAWGDSLTVFVGAKESGSTHRTVFEVSVDGQSIDSVTTSQAIGAVFGDVDAIASSAADQPLLISFNRRIWQLQGGLRSGQWTPPDGPNWMTGQAPFYPH